MTEDTFLNPESEEVKVLLYLYTMEPPFYAELNGASRTLNKEYLKTLGPYARAMYLVLTNG